MDLANSVIMPREDFQELQEAAWNQDPMTGKQRLASIAHTYVVFAGVAGAVTAGTWGWAKATNWLEERRLARMEREDQIRSNRTK